MSTLMTSCFADHEDALSKPCSDLSSSPPLGLDGHVAATRGADIPHSLVVPLSLSALSITDASSSASSSTPGPLLSSVRPCATTRPPKSATIVEGGVAKWRKESARSKEARDKKGDKDKETMEAGNRARQEQTKQKTIGDLPWFELPEKATSNELVKFLNKRFARYEALKSFDVCDMAVVTPPTDIVTYHIVDITRPSEGNSENCKSVLQLLVRETDNYIIGFRRTPGTRTDKDGFFLYSDIIVPEFFGVSHKLKCGSAYMIPNKIQIFKNVMTLMVKSLLEVSVDNCKSIKKDTRKMMETWMLILGECQRMQAPLYFLEKNYTSESPTNLSSEVIIYMNNWSYLSKAIFAFYLGVLEVAMGVDGSKETYFNGRRRVSAAVIKFRSQDCTLNLTDGHGFFSLKTMAKDCVRLLKYDDTCVKELIMRRNSICKSQSKHIKHPRNDENDKIIDDEDNKSEDEKEWQLYKQEGPNLIKKLLEQYDIEV